MERDLKLFCIQTLHVIFWDDHIAEAQLLCLGYALLNAVHRAHLTAKANLAGHAPTRLDGGVDVA